MCYSAFAAKGVTHWVKAIRSKGLSHQARTTSGSDELPSPGVEAIYVEVLQVASCFRYAIFAKNLERQK
jgi:hypothetical protein